tara:strand:- start:251 stop:649 length:399 start_codon:yes stop_codon:yes gene_type:complete
MTLEEFNKCYLEYAKNFAQYRAMDLNFKQVMYMKHSLSSGEFDDLIYRKEIEDGKATMDNKVHETVETIKGEKLDTKDSAILQKYAEAKNITLAKNKKTGQLDEIPLPDPEDKRNRNTPLKGMNRDNVQKAN